MTEQEDDSWDDFPLEKKVLVLMAGFAQAVQDAGEAPGVMMVYTEAGSLKMRTTMRNEEVEKVLRTMLQKPDEQKRTLVCVEEGGKSVSSETMPEKEELN